MTGTSTTRSIEFDLQNDGSDAFSADEGQIRHDLVIRVRRQIEMGIYDEDKRIDQLLDRLLDDLRA